MIYRVKLDEIFLEWYKQNNPHLYKKPVTKKERDKEMEEYVNDVLQEHMETMARYDTIEPQGPEDSEQ